MSTPERDPAERGFMRFFYNDWRPTRLGRIANRIMGWWSATGLPPSLQQTIEVRGRKSGKWRSSPIVVATVEGKRYLVSMLGPQSEWVRNIIAADGEAVLRHGRRERVRLVPIPPEERAPVLHEYVRIARSGRRHFPLGTEAAPSDFAAIAGRYPVFRIDRLETPG
jgi:deazaflavin-dependent oxidoreductase (nitroreductase family)